MGHLVTDVLGHLGAQSVKRLTSAQVVISRFVGSSPASGSVLTAWSLEPASDSVSPPLSAPPLLMLSLYLSIMNKLKKIFLNYFTILLSLPHVYFKSLWKK